MNIYNPFVTAISKDGPSAPLKNLIKIGAIEIGMRVLDYGAGRLRDSNFLNRLGCDVTAYDKYHPVESFRIKNLLNVKYDVAMSNYVFNVIEKKSDLFKAIEEFRAVDSSRKFISIRADIGAMKPNWVYDREEDCYFTGKSYQRFFRADEFEKYFGKYALLGKTSSYWLLELL